MALLRVEAEKDHARVENGAAGEAANSDMTRHFRSSEDFVTRSGVKKKIGNRRSSSSISSINSSIRAAESDSIIHDSKKHTKTVGLRGGFLDGTKPETACLVLNMFVLHRTSF